MIFIRGGACGICKNPIHGTPEVSLPHFVRNRRDPLFPLSGYPFHRKCFSAHPLHTQALEFCEKRLRLVKDSPTTCVVCGEKVHDNQYNTDYLTCDPSSPLYEFNFLSFHPYHLHDWVRFEEFRKLIQEFEHSGKYDGPPILPE